MAARQAEIQAEHNRREHEKQEAFNRLSPSEQIAFREKEKRDKAHLAARRDLFDSASLAPPSWAHLRLWLSVALLMAVMLWVIGWVLTSIGWIFAFFGKLAYALANLGLLGTIIYTVIQFVRGMRLPPGRRPTWKTRGLPEWFDRKIVAPWRSIAPLGSAPSRRSRTRPAQPC